MGTPEQRVNICVSDRMERYTAGISGRFPQLAFLSTTCRN
jgi:hypothetical protein